MPDLKDILRRLKELEDWKAAREKQQLVYPVDDTSRLALRVCTDGGSGSSPVSQNVNISAVPAVVTVPTVPTGTIILQTPSGDFEIPYF